MWVELLLKNWKIIALASVIAVVFGAGWKMGVSHIQSQWNEEKAATAIEMQKQVIKNAKTISDLEVQKNENINTIDKLAADNKRLHLYSRSCARPSDTTGSASTTTGDGALHDDASDAIAIYSEQVGQLFVEVDKQIESCRVMRDYLLSLNPSSP